MFHPLSALRSGRLALLFVFFAISLRAIPAFGANYYLDGDKGSDSHPGSESSPWKTFNRAQSQLQPGDTLYCTGDLGVVNMVTAPGPAGELPYAVGTADRPISYKAWNGKSQPRVTRLAFDGVRTDTHLSFEGFRFDRGEVDTPDSPENAPVYLAGAWHIAFVNCEVVGARARIPAEALDPAVSMAPYTPDYGGVISSGGNASFVTIRNCRIQNGGVGIAINENEAYADRQSRHWKILDNDISNSAEDGIQAGGWMAGSYSLIRGNTIHSQNLYTAPLTNVGFAHDANGPNPAAFEGHQWAPVIQDVTGRRGIYFYSKPLDANGWSRFYVFAADKNEPLSYFSPYGWKLASDPSIQFKPLDKDGVTPRIGDCAHTDCISIMAQMTDTLFENNRAHATNVVAKGAPGGGGLKIQNIPRSGRSTQAQSIPIEERSRPPTNVTFQNNLFYSTIPNAAAGFLLNVAGGKNVKFIHNTIFGAPGVRFVDMFGTGFDGIYFYNNIISGGGVSNTKATGIATSDHNLWIQPPEPGVQTGANDVILPSRRESRATIEELIESVGFVDSVAGDLRIKPGSPGHNVGAFHSESLPLPSDDINGFPRGNTPDDPPDAGAYEVGSPRP